MTETVVIEEPELRRSFRRFSELLEDALSLAALNNWQAQEALGELRDMWEREQLNDAIGFGNALNSYVLLAIADGEITNDERKRIVEMGDALGTCQCALREYDEHENGWHEDAAQGTADSRDFLRRALAPVSENLLALNHRRGGRRQPLVMGVASEEA